MVSALAEGLRSLSGATRTIRSPVTRTLIESVTLRSRGSNRRALRITRSPFGLRARAWALRSDNAASVFSCAWINWGIADAKASGTTENQDETEAAFPSRSSQIATGEKLSPVMRCSVQSLFDTETFPA